MPFTEEERRQRHNIRNRAYRYAVRAVVKEHPEEYEAKWRRIYGELCAAEGIDPAED